MNFINYLWSKKAVFFSLLFILGIVITGIILGIVKEDIRIIIADILLGFVPFIIFLVDEIKKYKNIKNGNSNNTYDYGSYF